MEVNCSIVFFDTWPIAIHNHKFLAPGDVPIHTWGEECIQASLQFQQDQPQLRLWVPKNVQSRTDQCKGGAVQQYSTTF